MSYDIQKTSLEKGVFICDGRDNVGAGHYRRCSELASYMRTKSIQIFFVEDYLSVSSKKYLKAKNFMFIKYSMVLTMLDSFQFVIFDHYYLSADTHKHLKTHKNRIIVIDDHIDRNYNCDVLINSTFGADKKKFKPTENLSMVNLLGTKYSFLNKEYTGGQAEAKRKKENFFVKNVHLFFGSNDQSEFVFSFLRTVLTKHKKLKFHLIITRNYKLLPEFMELERENQNLVCYVDVDKMFTSLLLCDIAVGAPGITTAERGCLGLPSLYCAVNKNQIEILRQMDKYGIAKYSGFIEHLEPEKFADSFFNFINDQKKLILMKKKSMETFDGFGIPRMTEAIRQL